MLNESIKKSHYRTYIYISCILHVTNQPSPHNKGQTAASRYVTIYIRSCEYSESDNGMYHYMKEF